MKPVIIYGNGTVAEVVYYFMHNDSCVEVAAFTIDKTFKNGDTFFDLPLVDFDELESLYPPDAYAMFIAVGYHDMNALRATRLAEARAKGYEIASYVHPDAGIPQNLKYGENCFIMNQVHIQPYVELGDNVFVWSGAHIGHHCKIGHHCWLASGANIAGRVTVGNCCLFAVGATVGNRVTIGNHCFLGANTLLSKDLTDEQVLIAESTKPFRLNSRQFFKLSPFSKM